MGHLYSVIEYIYVYVAELTDKVIFAWLRSFEYFVCSGAPPTVILPSIDEETAYTAGTPGFKPPFIQGVH